MTTTPHYPTTDPRSYSTKGLRLSERQGLSDLHPWNHEGRAAYIDAIHAAAALDDPFVDPNGDAHCRLNGTLAEQCPSCRRNDDR